MNYFQYRDQALFCEEIPVEQIAQEVGTPFYLYSHRTLRHHFRVFDSAFEEIPHIVCFSAKSNPNTSILHLFAREGGGIDIVSGGELYRALKAGVDPGKVVYSGVGKRDDEIDYALKTGILMFNVESVQELESINRRAEMMGVHAGVGLRVNPDVDPQTHPHISTGLKENKFGIDIEAAITAYRNADALKHLDIKGVSCHIGSQVTKVSPFIDALKRLKELIRQYGFNEVCPFNQCNTISIYIFFKSHLEHLLRIMHTIHIKMIQRHSASMILIDDGERGGGDIFFDT